MNILPECVDSFLPSSSDVNVKCAQDAVQIGIPVIRIATVVEDHSALDLMRKEVVRLPVTYPLRHLHLRDLSRARAFLLMVYSSDGDSSRTYDGATLFG